MDSGQFADRDEVSHSPSAVVWWRSARLCAYVGPGRDEVRHADAVVAPDGFRANEPRDCEVEDSESERRENDVRGRVTLERPIAAEQRAHGRAAEGPAARSLLGKA